MATFFEGEVARETKAAHLAAGHEFNVASPKQLQVVLFDELNLPKTKKIKTVRFGSSGLKAKINNPKARQAFAKRHKCSTKKDKTKASYWSCRLPRYAKLLGLKSNFSGFW